MGHNQLIAGAATDTGRRREHNEDAFFCDPEEGLFAVIDGVGGQAGGEVASAEAREVIYRRLLHRTGTPEERLREAVTNANSKIYLRSKEDPLLIGMACVLTTALIEEDRLYVAHVGDTRLYKIHNGRITKLTRDHSLVGVREDNQELSEYEAMHHPRRNEILRDVGSELHDPFDEDFIDIHEIPFEADSALLFCSDGLTDLVPSRVLLRTVCEHAGNPQAAVEMLIDFANEAGGTDNITVVIVEGPSFQKAASIGIGSAHQPEVTPTLREPDTEAQLAHVSPNHEVYQPSQAVAHSTRRATFPNTAPPATIPEHSTVSPWVYYFAGIATVIVLLALGYVGSTLGIVNLDALISTISPASTTSVESGEATEASLSLSDRLGNLSPGDTVLLRTGTYIDSIRLQKPILLSADSTGLLHASLDESLTITLESDSSKASFLLVPESNHAADSLASRLLLRVIPADSPEID